MVYITEKLAHLHVQNAAFGLFAAVMPQLVQVDRLVSYPLVLII